MARKAASGTGMVRKVERTIRGKKYIYWEARYTEGTDPGTGKQIQRSIYCNTQKEATSRLRQILRDMETGTYSQPNRMTLAEWLHQWQASFLTTQKPATVAKYKSDIEHHIIPALGAVRLQELRAEQIQRFYNAECETLSAKTVRNFHGTLHKALSKAVQLGYIPQNPASYCELAKPQKVEIVPLDPKQIVQYVAAAQDHPLGNMLITALFTGMRRGELLGLTWDEVDFSKGSVTIRHQLSRNPATGLFEISTPKNGKTRKIFPAQIAMDALRAEHDRQWRWMQDNVDIFDNPQHFVFTYETGDFIKKDAIRLANKAVLEAAGLPDIRLHDLRHSYAVTALQAGDDIKTIQEQLGHATAAFTLDVYAHALDNMKKQSAKNIQRLFDKNAGNGKHNGKRKKA